MHLGPFRHHINGVFASDIMVSAACAGAVPLLDQVQGRAFAERPRCLPDIFA
jgi:hypothetical protein